MEQTLLLFSQALVDVKAFQEYLLAQLVHPNLALRVTAAQGLRLSLQACPPHRSLVPVAEPLWERVRQLAAVREGSISYLFLLLRRSLIEKRTPCNGSGWWN